MSELGPEAFEVLARARRGLTPSAADAARVRAAVSTAVTVGADPLESREPAVPPSATPAGLTYGSKLGAVVALAAATGFGGYVLGFRAGVAERERGHSTPAVATTPPLVAPPRPRTAPLAGEAAAPGEAGHAPPLPVHAPKPERAAPSPNEGVVATPLAVGLGETSLELETRLLARVERALRDDNPRLALGLLGELERSVPGGQLAEERQAARAMAHCELGSDTAAKLAQSFIEGHAASAYVPRVREACAAALEKKDAP